MIHLPKKRPWIILLVIYVIILIVWGLFFFLAKETGDQSVDREEAKELLEKQKATQPSNSDAE